MMVTYRQCTKISMSKTSYRYCGTPTGGWWGKSVDWRGLKGDPRFLAATADSARRRPTTIPYTTTTLPPQRRERKKERKKGGILVVRYDATRISKAKRGWLVRKELQ